MKLRFTIATLVLLAVVVTSVAYAGGPWEMKVEGNGIVDGPFSDGVCEADIGWNMKMNYDREVAGHLNIVEKLCDGTVRHFDLYGYELLSVGDPTVRPILFNCATQEVRVEGYNAEGYHIAAHWRSPLNTTAPNTVWYWVYGPGGELVTNTNARLAIDSPMTMWCAY
jgi:hypothetical protein